MNHRVMPPGRTALVYLARGADEDCLQQFDRFVRAYTTNPAGLPHDLFIIFKGFSSTSAIDAGRKAFASLRYCEIHTEDVSFDIGAYADATQQIEADRICFLNTSSEPAASNWLLKLAVNLERPRVGLVGATGSFQTHMGADARFPPAPNLHVRSNAFMLRGAHAKAILGKFQIKTKREAYLAECGRDSITRQIVALGLRALIVGRNGRGYAPEWWPSSKIFCQGAQDNLLLHDNQTRSYARQSVANKTTVYENTWAKGRLPGRPFGFATP